MHNRVCVCKVCWRGRVEGQREGNIGRVHTHTKALRSTQARSESRYDFVAYGTEGDRPRTRITYKLKVEPNFPFPKMVKAATNKAVAKMVYSCWM